MPKIIGNPTVTPVMPSDWAQKDETKVDYIKNKPTKLSQFENDIEFVDREELDDALSGIGGNVDMSDYYTKGEIDSQMDELESIAKGRATGYVFNTLADLEAWLSDSANTANLVLGDNLYIRATNVPDYWWDGTSKQELETQKVDLTEYVKNTDYASSSQFGVVKVVDWAGTAVNGSGQIYLVKATNSEIDARVGDYKPIVPANLEHAVKSVGDGYYATEEQVSTKQNTITGSAGQFVIIGSDGNVTTKTISIAEEATF